MKRTILFFIGLLLVCTAALSQVISLDFPRNAGKSMKLVLKFGTQTDTIYQGNFDASGKAKITLPSAYQDYTGMAGLILENKTGVDFIINGESPVIRCNDEFITNNNIVFENSQENQNLQNWFISQYSRLQKLNLLSQAAMFYAPDDNFSASLGSELNSLSSQQSVFESQLRQSPLYAAKFIRFYNYLNREISALPSANPSLKSQVRNFVRDSLDINNLFSSGLWFNTLNGILALYDENSPYNQEFISDMSLLLDRANDKVFKHLAENVFTICETMGWNDHEHLLAYYLMNSGRAVNPTGKLQKLMTIYKLGKGNKAPELSQAGKINQKTLLVFYETACGNCETNMNKIKANYKQIQEKGYQVITISADKDKEIYAKNSATLPWEGKYCDFKGFEGVDFQNYGIFGTPTMYLIDASGIIQGRYARLEDTGLLK